MGDGQDLSLQPEQCKGAGKRTLFPNILAQLRGRYLDFRSIKKKSRLQVVGTTHLRREKAFGKLDIIGRIGDNEFPIAYKKVVRLEEDIVPQQYPEKTWSS